MVPAFAENEAPLPSAGDQGIEALGGNDDQSCQKLFALRRFRQFDKHTAVAQGILASEFCVRLTVSVTLRGMSFGAGEISGIPQRLEQDSTGCWKMKAPADTGAGDSKMLTSTPSAEGVNRTV